MKRKITQTVLACLCAVGLAGCGTASGIHSAVSVGFNTVNGAISTVHNTMRTSVDTVNMVKDMVQ